MNSTVHLMLVTTMSMIITFILYCIMEYVPSRKSFLQLYCLDYFRENGLMVRSLYNKGISTF
jgi:hypothetical protein